MTGKKTLQSISQAIFQEQPVAPAAKPDTTLYEEKVKLLRLRYHHHLTGGKTYDQILIALESEFFISSKRITDIIKASIPELQALRQEPPKRSWLQQNFSHLIW